MLALLAIGALAAATAGFPAGAADRPQRTFEFTYQASLKDLPAGAKKVRIWVPLPKSGPFQEISNLKIEGPGDAKTAEEPEHRNRMAYFEMSHPSTTPLAVTLTFKATRFENRVDLTKATTGDTKNPQVDRYLTPDRLGAVDDTVKQMTAKATAGKSSFTNKVRAIYDAVLEHMTYDKTGTGWGRGDTKHACTVGKGNCTDYHALFISMARSVGIPAKFAIGFPLPTDAKEGKIGGYHCWAYFFAPGFGWVPVDESEADKHPEKTDYFFGATDANRVEFTEGRDLKLVPPQDGEPLNFFVYPYVEVDGKPFDGMERSFSFKDVAPTRAPDNG